MTKFGALVAYLVGGILLLAAALPASASTNPPVQVVPSTRLHPALQASSQLDPTATVRVIVQTVKPDTNIPAEIASTLVGASVVEQFKVVPAFVLSLPAGMLPLLATNPNVRYVSPDGLVEVLPQVAPVLKGAATHPKAPGHVDEHHTHVSAANLQTTYPYDVDAPAAWSGLATQDGHALTGAGIGVAVLDSGIDATHTDLQNHSVAVDVNRHTQNTVDDYGHGTHIAGVIAGNDPSGQYLGIAPNATLVSVKVTDDNGTAFESDLLRGLDWVNQYRSQYHIGVVNLSVTTSIPESYATSPIDAAVEFLVHQNVTVVAAAGNLGSAEDAVWYAPANDPLAITVGCLDDNQTPTLADDSLCPISSRGITQDGFAKPDVVAPGRRIVSALASGTTGKVVTLAQEFPDRVTSDGRHIRLSGTSMAAAVVSGAAALLLERQGGLHPDQIRKLLVGTAVTYPGQVDHAGEINIPAAIAGAQRPPEASEYGSLPVGGTAVPDGAHTLLWDGGHWATVYWSSAHWDSAHWESAHWDSAHWDSAHWDNAYWDSAHWDSAHWDSAHWDSAHWDGARWDASSYD